MTSRRLALVLAGSDPSGGAGLELDLKVLALLGVHGAAIATCHTIQSATRMQGRIAASIALARRQLAAILRDAPIGVVKIGMLPSSRWVESAARALDRIGAAPAVYDPVIAPTMGPRALPRAALASVRRELLPRCELVTPNALEAAELLGASLAEVERDPAAAARALVGMGARSVLLKGGHLRERGRVIDRLRGAAGDADFESPRRRGAAPRGTGCALASAIAAGRLHGLPLRSAIVAARRWLDRARRGAVAIGSGRPYLGLGSRLARAV